MRARTERGLALGSGAPSGHEWAVAR